MSMAWAGGNDQNAPGAWNESKGAYNPALPAWAQGGYSPFQQSYQSSIAPPRPAFLDALTKRNMPNFAPPGDTGGGFGTLPSLQSYNRLAPSEQQGYGDWLQSNQGMYAPDVMNLMQQLKPQSYYGQTPKWAEF